MAFQRSLPRLWLVTDARNDAVLARTIDALPRGSGVIYRHRHLPPAKRKARFAEVARRARARGHLVAWAGSANEARRMGADAAYGSPEVLAGGPELVRLVTVHTLAELGRAQAIARADAVLISPVFATRSHPGGPCLGNLRFRLLRRFSRVPVISLGGMNRGHARALGGAWAAIDGLTPVS